MKDDVQMMCIRCGSVHASVDLDSICEECIIIEVDAEDSQLGEDVSIKVPDNYIQNYFMTAGANPDAAQPISFGPKIAQGGMGVIFKAEDLRLGREVAVKLMVKRKEDVEAQKRFIQEAAILGRLQHPNIIPVHDLGRDQNGQLYYSMKLVRGRTLQEILDLLKKGEQDVLEEYPLSKLIMIFQSTCNAISYAHSKGVIHCDLKPSNIMVGEFGEVLVMDWGISKILIDKGEEGVGDRLVFSGSSGYEGLNTLDGTIFGSPYYMSPEQARGEINMLDTRTDIYSLGGILYSILCLEYPVTGENIENILEKVLTGTIPPPSTHSGRFSPFLDENGSPRKQSRQIKIPASLSRVAMKALSLDPSKRYVTVSAISEELTKWQSGLTTPAEVETP